MTLLQYDFSVVYVKGKDNAVADALSRINIAELKELQVQIENSQVLVLTRSKAKQRKEENSFTPGHGTDHSEDPTICEILKKEKGTIELKALIERNPCMEYEGLEKEAMECLLRINKRVLYSEKEKIMYVLLPNLSAARALLDLDATTQALMELNSG